MGAGGHLYGRFCRTMVSPPTWRSQCNAGGAKIIACRFTAHSRCLFDPPKRPPKAAQCHYLIPLFFAQDITHANRGYLPPPWLMSRLLAMAGFEVTLYGRFWVTPEVP
jgi:hypothetical protein